MQLMTKKPQPDIFPIVIEVKKIRPWRRERSMNTSPLNLWIPEVLEGILLQKEGKNMLPLP